MSGISGIGSTQNLSSILQALSGNTSASEVPTEEQQALRPPMDNRLDEALASAGVDEETAAAIKSDLKAAFEETFSSSDSQPDPESIKEAVDGVFAEYGLDASSILGEPGEGGRVGRGGGPPPPPPSEGYEDSSDSTSDASKTLLELLQEYDEQNASASDKADLLVDYLFGLDETA